MKNDNTKRNQRTPAEIIAETEAHLERLRRKDAKQQAQSNPTVAALMAQKDEVQKDIREAKKIVGTGPQSADARIEKHQLWIEKIERSREDAWDTLGVAEQRLGEIDRQIQAEIASLVSSKDSAAEA
jgi:capsule polysaccharide export protein KpsE/RkpR